jgi:hypothetical protein
VIVDVTRQNVVHRAAFDVATPMTKCFPMLFGNNLKKDFYDSEVQDGRKYACNTSVSKKNAIIHICFQPKIVFNTNFKNPCWFERENLRCLPYVYIIGVKKCGTSDLFYRLSLHPEFVRPGFKEAQFFARKRFSK